MRVSVCLTTTFCWLALSGCGHTIHERMPFSPEAKRAQSWVDRLRQNDFSEIEEVADPNIDFDTLQKALVKMSELFPAGEPISVKVVSDQPSHGDPTSRSTVNLEYQYSDKWLLAEVTTQTTKSPTGGEATTITGLQVMPLAESLEAQNKFTLRHMGEPQYEILGLSLLALLSSLAAFVLCLRSNIARFKWLWLIAVFIGVGRVAVNWTTGQVAFTLFSVQVPPVLAFAPFYGTWTIIASLPFGALAFFAMRHRLLAPPRSTSPTPAHIAHRI